MTMALVAVCAHAALTAAQVLDRVSAALTKPASVSVTFSFKGQGGSGNGSLTVCRDLFTYNAGDLAVWYDGKSQWALQRSAAEVSLTEPTAEELVESNPFRIITHYKRNYTYKLQPAPKGQYKILLTAKSRSAAVRTAVVTVNACTFVPVSIEASMGAGARTTVTVKSFVAGKALPKSYFQFNPRLNKDVHVNDLR